VECRNYANCDPSALCVDLEVSSWGYVLNGKEVNVAWAKWKERFLNVFHKHAPLRLKTLRGMKCPWLTN